MKARMRNFLRGVGSVLDINPSTDYQRFVPKKTGAERMQSHWAQVGKHVSNAIKRFDNEQKHKAQYHAKS